jgi:hypothetical protein
MTTYTEDEFWELVRLARAANPAFESDQLKRILARLELAAFVEKHGLEKCEGHACPNKNTRAPQPRRKGMVAGKELIHQD